MEADPAPPAPVTVLATYRAAPGNEGAVAAALVAYTPLTRAEPGCVAFTAHKSADDPRVFVLYEQYRDRAALDAHVASEHYGVIARERIRPLLEHRNVSILQPLTA